MQEGVSFSLCNTAPHAVSASHIVLHVSKSAPSYVARGGGALFEHCLDAATFVYTPNTAERVGVEVGAFVVGGSVGFFVGFFVGLPVAGFAVGLPVAGFAVGLSVGCRVVGLAVGFLVGAFGLTSPILLYSIFVPFLNVKHVFVA